MASEEFLARARGLNLTPERVLDARFLEEDGFFDPKDLVQVRYELLRLSQVEEVEVTEACRRFGFSRTTYYKVAEAFARGTLRAAVSPRPLDRLRAGGQKAAATGARRPSLDVSVGAMVASSPISRSSAGSPFTTVVRRRPDPWTAGFSRASRNAFRRGVNG